MVRKVLISLLFYLSASICAHAQFFTAGDDPGRLKWSQIETNTYRIIYPRGLDSLAKVYAVQLESWSGPVSERLGFSPNEAYKKKMPVILHTGTSRSNGIVTWAPRRVDMFTVPDAFSPEAITSPVYLAKHESRHVAQMQYGRTGHFRPFHYIFGEMFSGAMSALYCGPAFFEGDAVHTESILDGGGRGHTSDFLDYYRMAFDNGDMRNWYRWRYGSQKYYTPDYYRVGYLTFAGMEERFGMPDFAQRYFDRLFEHKIWFFPVGNLGSTTRKELNMTFKEAFSQISGFYQQKWRDDIVSRGPFMPGIQVSASPKLHEEYLGSVYAGSSLHSIKKGLLSATTMDGKPFASTSSPLKYSKFLNALVWSETVPDLRWSLLGYSDIFYKPEGSNRHIRLTHKKRYYNPAPDESGRRIAVTEYPSGGGSRIVVLDARDGKPIGSMTAPDSLQIVESAWMDDRLIISGISQGGFGLYDVTGEQLSCILSPRKHKIKQLWSRDGDLYFTSDETGVNELYRYCDSGFEKMTNTRYGASEFTMDDRWLFYSELSPEGRLVHKTEQRDLPTESFIFSESKDTITRRPPADTSFAVSEVKKYSKAEHLIKFHSWAPVYFNRDGAVDGTFDELYKVVNIGAVAMFQNELGTMSGMVGYSLHKGNGGYVNLTYTGLYPVIAGQVNFGGYDGFNGYVGTYVPLNFSSGGWSRGLRPRLTYSWYGDKKDNLEIAVRGYTIRPIASSGVYPRWGIGAETGYNTSIRQIYQYIYGYIPGIIPQHGLKLTAMVGKQNVEGDRFYSCFTADYAMAVLPLDWSGISPVAYLRNFEVTVHAEAGKKLNKVYTGIGGSLVARLGNLLWIPYDTRIGVSYLYCHSESIWNLVLSIDL